MKKQFIFFSVLAAAVVFTSCGNNSNDNASGSNTMSDSSNATTSTTGTSTMSSDTANTSTMSSGTTTTAANNVGETDKKFMMDAASGGMLEVEAGRMAEQTASNPRVKAYGTMMVQDHTNANNELKALASSKGVMLSDSMMAKQRQDLAKLKGKTGKDFDKAYMSMMSMDHKEDINKFQTASNNAADADVKAFATKTLPTLRKHMDSVQAINGAKMKM